MRSGTDKVTCIIIVAFVIIFLSCCRKNSPQHDQESAVPAEPTFFNLTSPGQNTVIHCGDSVKLAYAVEKTVTEIDSIVLYSGKDHIFSKTGNPGELWWNSRNSKMGQTTLRLSFYFSDSLQESHNVNVVVLSDVVPKNYKYRVVAKYPHDNQAYTQGLIFNNGTLYESTGLNGKSTVRIVDLATGKPEKLVPIPEVYFGEGIALFKDQIYMITWKNQVGFVFDKKTLGQIRSFDYQIREGWGLTTDGKNLIMTDGSSGIYFIEPEFFTQVSQVNVFDDKGMIDSLNEIEYINGKIVANVYGKTFIVIIDPATGKVLGKAEFGELMPKGYENDFAKVLNGIAFNPATGHLYITGKNWPVLYEVELIPAV